MEQDYLMVDESTNIVVNAITWDGNPNTWKPPIDMLMLLQATTPAKNWVGNFNTNPYSWELFEKIGTGGIDFTWDGSVLTTNQPEPINPPTVEIAATNQPPTTGTQTLG